MSKVRFFSLTANYSSLHVPTLDFGHWTLDSIKRVTENRDKKQAVLLIGYQGATVDNPDRYALELLQEACSDLGSRLFMRIREKLGLAYYVGAQNLKRRTARSQGEFPGETVRY